MTNQSDSFIDEVTEELQRDRLFALLRRYGWIAITLVVGAVAFAGWNEWTKAQARQQAQDSGDAIFAAIEADSPSDLRAIATDHGDLDAVITLLAHGLERETDSLRLIAENIDLDPRYRDLAALKLAMQLGPDQGDDARTLLEQLTQPGAPYRLLALEQIALIDAAQGDTAGAISQLRDLVQRDGVSATLRNRARQSIVAMGGSLTDE